MSHVKHLLVVCLGNICRSPTAYGFFKELIAANHLPMIVDSAGIEAMEQCSPDQHVLDIMQEQYDIDLSAHVAKQLTEDMMRKNDLILVMDQDQQRYLERSYPFACGKVFPLGKWRNTSVRDPYHQSYAIFSENIALIQECVMDWIKKLH